MNRPEKLSHRETIVYEINMLDYCYERLYITKDVRTNREKYALIECFLLHFRNLTDFFGKRPKEDDLSVSKPDKWAAGDSVDNDQIRKLAADGEALWQEFENRNKRKDTISRYLQHCTEQRIEPKEWPLAKMYNKIRSITVPFCGLVHNPAPVARDDPRTFGGALDAASTATVQVYRPLITEEP